MALLTKNLPSPWSLKRDLAYVQSAYEMKFWVVVLNIVSHERPFDTEKNVIYRFFISLLVPEL